MLGKELLESLKSYLYFIADCEMMSVERRKDQIYGVCQGFDIAIGESSALYNDVLDLKLDVFRYLQSK